MFQYFKIALGADTKNAARAVFAAAYGSAVEIAVATLAERSIGEAAFFGVKIVHGLIRARIEFHTKYGTHTEFAPAVGYAPSPSLSAEAAQGSR